MLLNFRLRKQNPAREYEVHKQISSLAAHVYSQNALILFDDRRRRPNIPWDNLDPLAPSQRV